MKKEKSLTITKITFIIIICILYSSVNAQFINKFGIKGGLLLSQLSFSNEINNGFIIEPNNKYACLKTDFAIYAEMFDSRNFCASVELHYLNKGEDVKNKIQVNYLETVNSLNIYNYRFVNDRFQYIALHILPRWRFIIKSEDKMYIYAGATFSYRIDNYSVFTDNAISFQNSKLLTGFKTGYGIELWDLFLLEISYSHDFNNAYVITYGNQRLERKHNSFDLLAGLSLKKLLRIHL